MNYYRIIEGEYGFMVQLEVNRTKGYLWRKREYKEWANVNKYGDEPSEMLPFTNRPESPSCSIRPPFKTLKKAKKFIKKLQKENSIKHTYDRYEANNTYIPLLDKTLNHPIETETELNYRITKLIYSFSQVGKDGLGRKIRYVKEENFYKLCNEFMVYMRPSGIIITDDHISTNPDAIELINNTIESRKNRKPEPPSPPKGRTIKHTL